MSGDTSPGAYGEPVVWQPVRPKFKATTLLLSWAITAIALWFAALVLPGVTVMDLGASLAMAVVLAVLNAILPPIVASLRLPFMLGISFILVLLLNALAVQIASDLTEGIYAVDSFGWAMLVALVVAAVTIVLQVIFGTNDDDTYTFRVVQRVAKRQGGGTASNEAGIIYLEIDGLALPVLRKAMRDGNTPNMARWLSGGTHRLVEWETDLSSQTGASQAGILLGSNEDIPAFRWVEKESGMLMTCSAPEDCAEIERRVGSGVGLLANGGSSRGNLLSGEAEEVILTVSRIEAEKRANPGYRAFFANGFNVTRALALFGWEVVLEWTAASRQRRRDVRPRGHRGGLYPLIRAAMCVVVRDLIVYGVLTDMMRGRSAVYATFSSYDEVAHHSGLERADTLEALRKLDEQFGRIDRARRYAPRPYVIVVLSDHGQTQGATFKQRNGYGLDELVERSLEATQVSDVSGGDEQQSMVGNAIGRGDRPQACEEAIEEGRLGHAGGGARFGQPRADLSDGAAASPDPGGAEREPPSAGSRAACASPCRVAADPIVPAWCGGSGRATVPTISTKSASRATIRSPTSRPARPGICCAPTDSLTSPTSWLGASTIPSSRMAAPSRS